MENQRDYSAPRVSIVVPMLNEAPVVGHLLRRLEEVFSAAAGGWELVAVDDGSSDGTWGMLKIAAGTRPWLRGISLERSFGQHPAVIAGLDAARGEIIVTMDADLQVCPEDMAKTAGQVEKGADIAFAVRDHGGEGILRGTIGSWLAGFMARHSAGRPENALSTFFAVRRSVVERALPVTQRSRPVVPFEMMMAEPQKVVWMTARNERRTMGDSKYGARSLVRLTGDIFFGYCTIWRSVPIVAWIFRMMAGKRLAPPAGGCLYEIRETF